MFHLAKSSGTESPSNASPDDQLLSYTLNLNDASAAAATTATPKKKRSRGRRRKPKSRNKVEPMQKKSPTSKKQHDAPMKKRDLYFSLTCAMVGINGGSSVVARVSIINWDKETVLDTFVHVPVPVTDFKDSGISPNDIRKSRTNLNAKSFSEVRQLVDQTLRGKILIGHQLSEKLTALGLTHPSSDVRDAAIFFKDADLSMLSQRLLKKNLPACESSDYALVSCATALELYKTYRKQWEEDLIHKAQDCQQQLMVQMKKTNPAPSQPQYNVYHPSNKEEPQQQRFPSYEVPPPVMQPYSQHVAQGHSHIPSQHLGEEDNSSWFVRGPEPPKMQYQAQPALSSKAMQALSSYDYAPYDHTKSASYDGSCYESSTDYTDYTGSSYIDGTSVASESVATASIASSMHEDDAPAPESSSSSSWFRFGSRKPPKDHMSSVCEEEQVEATPVDSSKQDIASYEPPRYFANEVGPEGSSKQSSSWFAFRRSKSPGAENREKFVLEEEELDPLNSSRSHGCPDLVSLSLEESTSNKSSDQIASLSPADENQDTMGAAGKSDEKSSSSWFSFRRSKSFSGPKQGAGFVVDHTESTANDDEDWLKEVMDHKPEAQSDTFTKSSSKNSAKGGAWEHNEMSTDSLEQEQQSKDSSSKLFRFLRSSKSSACPTSRLATLDDDGETQPGSSFEDDAEGWTGQVMRNPSDGWNGPGATGGLFMPPARARFPTESTIQSVVSEEIKEPEGEDSFSQDLFEGMEQNLAFLNI